MSIRLRLTLLYTAILALTLSGFGAVLYSTQWQSMRGDEERFLSGLAQRIVEFRQSGAPEPPEPAEPRPIPPPWRERASEQGFGKRPIYTQIISPAGEVADRSEDLGEATLPLSDAGLEALGRGEPWVEAASIEDEQLLVYSAPVIINDEVVEIVQVASSIAEQEQYLETMRGNLLIGGGAAILVAFGTGWILSGIVLRPIHRIAQTARTIGAERDLSRRVQHTGPNDELGRLATTFNAMLAELEIAHRQQQQFVADVSHELRTPLTTLRGNLELLRREPPISDEDRAEIISDMTEESERLIRLVNDLLMLARVDARQPLHSEPVAVKPLVEDVCRQARLLTPERQIACHQLPDLAAAGDRDALKQVLLILVDNALKHTDAEVTIAVQVVDETVKMSVQDTGPGIASERLPHIFERFHGGKNAPGESSVGLGLAIAKALVEAQGGTIAVESQVGRGSTFTVSMPRVADPRQ